jgi:hypothetical protein
MKKIKLLFFLLVYINSFGQTINLNEQHLESYLRNLQLLGEIDSDFSFTLRPLFLGVDGININDTDNLLINFKNDSKSKINFKILPIDFSVNYNSHHPYNRNNGSMVPAKGFQQLFSSGAFIELGPLSIQFKPEYHYAENLEFDGFWKGHYPKILARRYQMWNLIDNPERIGDKAINKFYLGQSSIRLNYKNFSVGLSNENIWWGPSLRNSIMMSNNAKGFKHITFNTKKPLKTFIGNFEWQFVTGRLENSNSIPSFADFKYANHGLYVEKNNDWRFFQGFTITYSPKYVQGLSIGFIRWIQAYSEFIIENKDYFPAFDNLFRKNDKYGTQTGSNEQERDQAAGVFLRWLWIDSKAEIYAEFHYNDAKANLRDLLLDSDHARASTIGIRKIFKRENKNSLYEFNWEWTQMEQTSSRLLRNAGSWYMHFMVRHGYTNRGEVMGSSIGPGSNSHYFNFSLLNSNIYDKIGIGLEIIDQDNDFLYYAFEDSKDFRRYWKDYNLHLNFNKKFKKLLAHLNIIYSRSINYQWELDSSTSGEGYDYYIPGNDINNFILNLKVTYPLDF